ncbi:MAG: ester cyclase [Angelakisella sp.]|jgi:predicted ester cyclase|nr:ester cyclase [Angelakisella sp.]
MDEKELVRCFYETLVSQNRLEELPRFLAEDCRFRSGERLLPMGISGMREHLLAVRKTYPDYTMRIIRQHLAGPYVISEFVMEGTHLGEFCGIAPSGRRLSFTGVDIDRVEGGRIVEHGGAVNTFDTLLAHGLIRGVTEQEGSL